MGARGVFLCALLTLSMMMGGGTALAQSAATKLFPPVLRVKDCTKNGAPVDLSTLMLLFDACALGGSALQSNCTCKCADGSVVTLQSVQGNLNLSSTAGPVTPTPAGGSGGSGAGVMQTIEAEIQTVAGACPPLGARELQEAVQEFAAIEPTVKSEIALAEGLSTGASGQASANPLASYSTGNNSTSGPGAGTAGDAATAQMGLAHATAAGGGGGGGGMGPAPLTGAPGAGSVATSTPLMGSGSGTGGGGGGTTTTGGGIATGGGASVGSTETGDGGNNPSGGRTGRGVTTEVVSGTGGGIASYDTDEVENVDLKSNADGLLNANVSLFTIVNRRTNKFAKTLL